MNAPPSNPRPRIPPASLPPAIRRRLWWRAREHDARNVLLRLLRVFFSGRTPAASGDASPRRLLLVRTGRTLGDMTMVLSLAAGCRRLFPDIRIAAVMRETLAPFFAGAPDLDAIHVLPRRALVSPRATVRLFRALRAGWDAAIACDPPGKSSMTALALCLVARAGRRIGFANEESRAFLTDAVSAPSDEPMRASLLRLTAPLKPETRISFSPPLPRVVPDSAALAAAENLLGRGAPATVIFVSKHWSKGWPLAAWLRVASCLTDAGHRIRLAFGPGDDRAADPAVAAWVEKSGGRGAVLLAQAPAVLIATLAKCRLFLSNDCGPYHLAVAAGARCVGVFSTDEARRDFGYEAPGRFVAIHASDPLTAEARVVETARALLENEKNPAA
ncbi:MAG: glycosyltransferase family 9 protein [Verrucomicrobiae bacterium]|nr:glycosyltransferase family 9 protein [Verrucomicrobiae bacterium]